MRRIKEIKQDLNNAEEAFLTATSNSQRKSASKQASKLQAELLQAKLVKKSRKAKEKRSTDSFETKLDQLSKVGKETESAPPVTEYDNSPEAKAFFQVRIKNEEKNIFRQFGENPQAIIKFIEANRVDEKNAAVRFGRVAPYKWAQENKDLTQYQNLMPW